jgi:glycosyltransferase involved in cell wall biosynthesis
MHNDFKELLINANNIHSGGGAVLLNKFITSKSLNKFLKIQLIVDERFDSSNIRINNVIIQKVKPTIISRLISELKIAKFEGSVLAFGNLPPLFSRSKRIIVFLHNVLYFYPKLIAEFPLKVRIRLHFERVILAIKCRSVSKFLVQTPHMKRQLIEHRLAAQNKILVAPFADLAHYQLISKTNKSFICVSSGDPHKNIKNLILAWKLLGEEGIFPKLYLTVSSKIYRNLDQWINEITKENQLEIINLGNIGSMEINDYYQSGSALIFPSFCESLGLPLIEADYCGVAILAPELDYVRDIITPAQTFDPHSPISIARAVKRHLRLSEDLTRLLEVEEVVNEIL